MLCQKKRTKFIQIDSQSVFSCRKRVMLTVISRLRTSQYHLFNCLTVNGVSQPMHLGWSSRMANSETSENDIFSSRKFMNCSWSFNDRFNFPQFNNLRSVPDCLPFVRDVLVNKRFKIDIRNFKYSFI